MVKSLRGQLFLIRFKYMKKIYIVFIILIAIGIFVFGTVFVGGFPTIRESCDPASGVSCDRSCNWDFQCKCSCECGCINRSQVCEPKNPVFCIDGPGAPECRDDVCVPKKR